MDKQIRKEEREVDEQFEKDLLGFGIKKSSSSGPKDRFKMKDLMVENECLFSTNPPEFYMCENEDQWLMQEFMGDIKAPCMNFEESSIIQKALQYVATPNDQIQREEPVSVPLQPIRQTKRSGASARKNKFVVSQCQSSKTDVGLRKNESKNVPKNYGKEIIRFVSVSQPLVQKMLDDICSPVSYDQLNQQLQSRKHQTTNIGHLRYLWHDSIYAREIRTISQYFIRKEAFPWMFNSRIERLSGPLKYRRNLLAALKNPKQFRHLKTTL